MVTTPSLSPWALVPRRWPRLIPSLPLWGRAEAPRPDMTGLQSSEYAPTPLRAEALPQSVILLGLALLSVLTSAQDTPTRLLRYPAISADLIAFVYAGDIWLVPLAGGYARQLTSGDGEELFPRFSPDGRTIAFTGQYDGRRQVYTIPVGGGTPKQLTFYNDVVGMPPRGGVDNRVLGLDAGRDADSLQRAPHAVERAHLASAPRCGSRRHGEPAADARGRGRLALAGRQAVRVHAHHARVPHVEAVSRRPCAGRLDLRPRREHVGTHHRLRRHRQPARLDRATPSISRRIAARTRS